MATCVRCAGRGDVCAQCKENGWLYLLDGNGRSQGLTECACGIVAQRRATSLLPFLEQYSSLSGELRHKAFENFLPRRGHESIREAADSARKFAKSPKGWLVLNGPPGAGKTHLAAAIANDLLRRKQPALFLNVPDLLNFLREAFRPKGANDPSFEQRLRTIRDFPVLILDDWGAHSDTPWADEQLYLILNHRTERNLPTVVTSNLPMEDLEPRVRSRLMNRRIGKVIECIAPDYRMMEEE